MAGPAPLDGGDAEPRVRLDLMTTRYSTSTRTADERLVPWLAAEGPLSYTPETPPARDNLFQYGWVLPQVCQPGLRRHLYFGAYTRDQARDLFNFWESARRGAADLVARHSGGRANGSVEAPIAVYRHGAYPRDNHYLLVQHGSYQFVPRREQPEIEVGYVLLHRGVGNASVFRFPFGRALPSRQGGDAWERYVALQFEILSRSDLSFNSVHDRAKRSETCHINDRTWISDELAAQRGLEIKREPWTKTLWNATHQSFSLRSWVSEHKFGPNRVVCRTPLTNIRITTFFAGEHEVRIIDPDRVELVAAIGCDATRES